MLHFLATVLIITKIAFSVNLYADFSLYFTYFLLIFPTFLLNLPFYYKTKLSFIFYFSIYFSIRNMFADFSLSYWRNIIFFFIIFFKNRRIVSPEVSKCIFQDCNRPLNTKKDRTGREFSGLYGLSNNICPLSGYSVFYEILIT